MLVTFGLGANCMKPDPLFVSAGIAVGIWSAYVIVRAILRKHDYSTMLAGALWALFAAGLLVQGFAPHLEIRNNAFVMPQSLITGHQAIDPEALVVRAKSMGLLSAVLMCGGAIGLAIHYCRAFFGPQPPTAPA